MIKKTISRYSNGDESVLSSIDLHPVLKRIYINRGVSRPEELENEFQHLLPFSALLNIDPAASILVEALKNQRRIIIIGDYDVDGATSTALMVLALRALGAHEVDYLVPDRFTCGYGLSPKIVDRAKEKGAQLIVTVDNGIASIEGVQQAHNYGIPVLITDHHLAGQELPAAAAIVNPNQPNDPFLSKNLSGVGVAFYVLIALRAQLRKEGWFTQNQIPEPNLAEFLDLVALGTVADLVIMDHNNRILVSQGLKRIQKGQCRSGIKALIEISGQSHDFISASELGYRVGPRLNAAGRLDDMSLGISCLLTDDQEEARSIAQRLDQLNQERQQIETTMRQEAFKELEKKSIDEKAFGICLLNENWHQGIIGILASKIKDRYLRPVIAFAKQNDEELKGSARTIEGLHIRDILQHIANEHPGLIIRFGGHAMAAGLNVPVKAYDQFVQVFNQEVARRLEGKEGNYRVMSDGELAPEEINIQLAALIRQAAPWGPGFAAPLFDGRFQLLEQRLLQQRHLKMLVKTGGIVLESIAFDVDPTLWPNEDCEFVHLAYRVTLDEYRGYRKVKLIAEHVEAI